MNAEVFLDSNILRYVCSRLVRPCPVASKHRVMLS